MATDAAPLGIDGSLDMPVPLALLAGLEGVIVLSGVLGVVEVDGLVASGVPVPDVVPVLGDVLLPPLDEPIVGLLAPEGVSVLRLQADNAASAHTTAMALRMEYEYRSIIGLLL